jgi:hypothetical protein
VLSDVRVATLIKVTEVVVSDERTEAALDALVSGDAKKSGRAGDRARRALRLYREEALARAEAISYNERCDVGNCAPCPGDRFKARDAAADLYGRTTHVLVTRA